jgi:hypothetical protein
LAVKQRYVTTVMQQNRGAIKTIHPLGPLVIPWEEHIPRDIDLGSFAMQPTEAFHARPTGFGPREQRPEADALASSRAQLDPPTTHKQRNAERESEPHQAQGNDSTTTTKAGPSQN